MRNLLVLLQFVLLFTTYTTAQSTEVRPEWSYKTGVIATGKTSFLKVYSFFANGRTQAYEKLKESVELDRQTAIGVRKSSADDGETPGFIYSYQELGSYMEKVAHGGMYYFLVQVCKTYNCPEWEKVKISSADYGFSPSVFVPGMSQIGKGQKFKGSMFIIGEIACIGGAVAAFSKKSDYQSKINMTKDLNLKKNYSDRSNTCKNVGTICIAAAVGLYVWNVIDGIVSKGKIRTTFACGDELNMRIVPYSTFTESGLAMNIKF